MQNITATATAVERPAPGHEIAFGNDAAARIPGAHWACTCGAHSKATTRAALRRARERHDDQARAAARR